MLIGWIWVVKEREKLNVCGGFEWVSYSDSGFIGRNREYGGGTGDVFRGKLGLMNLKCLWDI